MTAAQNKALEMLKAAGSVSVSINVAIVRARHGTKRRVTRVWSAPGFNSATLNALVEAGHATSAGAWPGPWDLGNWTRTWCAE